MDPVLTQSDVPATPLYPRHLFKNGVNSTLLSQEVGLHCIQVNITLLSEQVPIFHVCIILLSQQVLTFHVSVTFPSEQIPDFHVSITLLSQRVTNSMSVLPSYLNRYLTPMSVYLPISAGT